MFLHPVKYSEKAFKKEVVLEAVDILERLLVPQRVLEAFFKFNAWTKLDKGGQVSDLWPFFWRAWFQNRAQFWFVVIIWNKVAYFKL